MKLPCLLTLMLCLLLMPARSEVLRGSVPDAGQGQLCMRGDTVVFHPEAFRMEDGDRLMSLVERLPGVSVRDGKLLWNGTPLRLMMNGLDVLDEDMMLNVVPVHAVDHVLAYGRASGPEDGNGVTGSNSERVLDVRVKPGFMDRFHGEAQARAYAGREYAVSLDVARLSYHNPLTLYVRVADDPEHVDYQSVNGRTIRRSGLPIRQQVGGLAYRHLWKPQSGVKPYSHWDITAGANHWEETRDTWEERTDFLADGMPVRRSATSRAYAHNLEVPLEFTSCFNLGRKNTLAVDLNVSYLRERRDDTSGQQTSRADGPVIPVIPVNTSTREASARTEGISVEGSTHLTHYLAKGSLGAIVRAGYEGSREDGRSLGEYRYLLTEDVATDEQRFRAPRHRVEAALGLDFSRAMGRHTMFHGLWETAYTHRSLDEERWRNGMHDPENSSYRRDDNWDNTFSMVSTYRKGRFSMTRTMKAGILHQQTRYRRSSLDTLATRTLALMRSFMEASYKVRPQMLLRGTFAFDSRPADMMDCIDYTDNTDPLYIRRGNPDLEKEYAIDLGLHFSMMRARHSRALSVSACYSRSIAPVATVLHHNPHTGVYTERKRNVHGGDIWQARLTYECSPARDLVLRNELAETYDGRYGILTIVDDAAGLTTNRQGHSRLTDSLSVMYGRNAWAVCSSHAFRWNRHSYSNPALPVLDLFRYTADLSLRYRLKQWQFTLSPQYIMDSGYASSRMNGHQLLLNARVDFSFMKNHAELVLYAHDLLNRQKAFYSDITATSHTEGGERILQRHVTLTFKYRFNPKTK